MTAGQLLVCAKINLSLVVGPTRSDGLHEVATVMQRIDLCDELELEPANGVAVLGFDEDTIVRGALERLADAAGVEPRWRATLRKAIPLAAGLGGGSADAAAALVLANRTLDSPFGLDLLRDVAASVGADVPFFLEPGPKLASGAGELLEPLELPQDYWVVVALAAHAVKQSTGSVYARFDELGGARGFGERRADLQRALASCRRAADLAILPGNDLAAASGAGDLAVRLRDLGAFRSDVSGAGPSVYGLFHEQPEADRAATVLGDEARTWVVEPVW